MNEFDGEVKICPILAAFSAGKDSTSSGSSWAIRCKTGECAWWSAENEKCSVAVMAHLADPCATVIKSI